MAKFVTGEQGDPVAERARRAGSRSAVSERPGSPGGTKLFEPAPARVRRRTDDLLNEVLHGSQPTEVRCEAAFALAALGRSSREVVRSLASTLEDRDETVRRSAALALGRTRDGSAAEPLLDALENSPELWEESAAALCQLRYTPAIPHLREMVRSAADSRTRRGAIRALAALSASAERLPVEDLFPLREGDNDARCLPL